ncbi:peptide deformylase [Anaerolineales bacterium HSG24]|nr:peptide deformylase [Anaerolineales bacterium HSG24]
MGIKRIIEYPNDEEALRRKSKPVRTVNRRIKKLVQDLKDTLMDRPEGVGLAAVQINIHSRVFVVRLGTKVDGNEDEDTKLNPPVAMINAEILEAKNEEEDFDGCLSFPGLFGDTIRPHFIRVKGLDEWGKPFEKIFEGFDAVLIHHEIDHTNGVLFIDRAESMKKLYVIQEDEEGNWIKIPIDMKKPS